MRTVRLTQWSNEHCLLQIPCGVLAGVSNSSWSGAAEEGLLSFSLDGRWIKGNANEPRHEKPVFGV